MDLLLQKKLLCQIVAQILITDLVLTDSEGDFLEHLMDELELDDAVRREVKRSVNVGGDIGELVAALDPTHRDEILATLQRAAEVDGAMGEGERALIARVAEALDAMG